MKRNISLVLLFVLLTLFSCNDRANNKSSDITEIAIFSPSLEAQIRNMIAFEHSKEKKDPKILKVYNVAITRDKTRNDKCVVIISVGLTAVEKTMQFSLSENTPDIEDNSSIRAYTFLEKELIVCYLHPSCNQNLVDTENLIKMKDSIPGYPEIFNTKQDFLYDAPMKIFEIVDGDSLKLIQSEFVE